MTHGGYPANAEPMLAPRPNFTPPNVGLAPGGPGFPPAVRGNGFAPPGYGVPPSPHGQRPGEVNNLATLSVVFAFVFAPIGIALGHLALSQIRYSGQAGRDRALVGLTVSYVVSLVAVVALIVTAAAASSGDISPSATTSTTTTTTSTTNPTTSSTPRTSPRTTTTVEPPSPSTPTMVRVDDLKVGDCVEVEQGGPDPNRPGYEFITIFSSACQVGDNIYQVDRIATRAEACPKTFLVNRSETIFACVSRFTGI
jgi:Domain of unknown function (DUF4190)